MAGWNSILGRTSDHSVNDAQQKMVDEANRIMQETRRINSKDNAWHQNNGYGAGGHVPTRPTSQMAADGIVSDIWRLHALAMRLRVREGDGFPFRHISTAWAGEKIFIFIVTKNGAVTFEDDAALFPSDTIITALRLIQE